MAIQRVPENTSALYSRKNHAFPIWVSPVERRGGRMGISKKRGALALFGFLARWLFLRFYQCLEGCHFPLQGLEGVGLCL